MELGTGPLAMEENVLVSISELWQDWRDQDKIGFTVVFSSPLSCYFCYLQRARELKQGRVNRSPILQSMSILGDKGKCSVPLELNHIFSSDTKICALVVLLEWYKDVDLEANLPKLLDTYRRVGFTVDSGTQAIIHKALLMVRRSCRLGWSCGHFSEELSAGWTTWPGSTQSCWNQF